MNISNNNINNGVTFASTNYIPEEFYNGSNIKGVAIQITAASVSSNLSISLSSSLQFDGSEIHWGDGTVTSLPVTGTISHTYKTTSFSLPPSYSIYIKDCTKFTSSLTDSSAKIFSSNNNLIKNIYLGNGVEVSKNIFAGLSSLIGLYNVNANNLALFGGDNNRDYAIITSLKKLTFSPLTKVIRDEFLDVSNVSLSVNLYHSLSFVERIGSRAFIAISSNIDLGSNTLLNLSSVKYIGDSAFLSTGANKIKTVLFGQKEIQLGSNCFNTPMLSQSDFKCLYSGTPTEWDTLVSGAGKTLSLTEKTYYYFKEYPGEGIKAWHYVNGVPTIW